MSALSKLAMTDRKNWIEVVMSLDSDDYWELAEMDMLGSTEDLFKFFSLVPATYKYLTEDIYVDFDLMKVIVNYQKGKYSQADLDFVLNAYVCHTKAKKNGKDKVQFFHFLYKKNVNPYTNEKHKFPVVDKPKVVPYDYKEQGKRIVSIDGIGYKKEDLLEKIDDYVCLSYADATKALGLEEMHSTTAIALVKRIGWKPPKKVKKGKQNV